MKNPKSILLSELNHALYRDGLTPDELSGGGSGTSALTATGDFIMVSGSISCPGCEIGYNERVAPKSNGTTAKPIHDEEEPARVMSVMPLPMPGESWTMSIKVTQGEVTDTVEMAGLDGDFASVVAGLATKHPLIFEEPGIMSTFQITEDSFLSIMDINQPDVVAQLSHSVATTFDNFRFSFLVRT